MLFNDENLIGKIPRNLVVYFDKQHSHKTIFQIHIYSIGNDSLPLNLLNKQELAFTSNKIGWNELPLQLEYLTIPKNGIAIIVIYFDISKSNFEGTDRIAMGMYSTKKLFFIRPTSQNNWLIFKAYKDGKVGPIMKLIAGN
jgi:hypothetical protein